MCSPFIFIDSNQDLNRGTHASGEVLLPERCSGQYALEYFQMPNQIFNIMNEHNIWHIGLAGNSITIPPGLYSPQDIVDYISNAFDPANGILTYNSNTNKFHFQSINPLYGINWSLSSSFLVEFLGGDQTQVFTTFPGAGSSFPHCVRYPFHHLLLLSMQDADNRDIEGTDYFNSSCYIPIKNDQPEIQFLSMNHDLQHITLKGQSRLGFEFRLRSNLPMQPDDLNWFMILKRLD